VAEQGKLKCCFAAERQVPRCPELHPHHPANGSFAGGQTGALICKAKSEFPPGLYWLKRIADPGVAAPPPPVHHDVCDAVATPDMTPNRTLSMGKDRYQVCFPFSHSSVMTSLKRFDQSELVSPS